MNLFDAKVVTACSIKMGILKPEVKEESIELFPKLTSSLYDYILNCTFFQTIHPPLLFNHSKMNFFVCVSKTGSHSHTYISYGGIVHFFLKLAHYKLLYDKKGSLDDKK